jgi:hypothetical protein
MSKLLSRAGEINDTSSVLNSFKPSAFSSSVA